MNVSRLMLSLLLMSAFMETKAQMTVEVTNPSNEYREEVIELPLEEVCKRLKTTCDSIRVLDRAGLDIPCQWTHDGKLLIGAYVRKHGTNSYTLVKGATPQFPDFCDGTIHPERKDDFAWENDRGAYRV